ncbi:Fic family protein [Rubrivirga sp.]|uniref:Fic family protein n=1 Tax=Rubrivirga sp. TaxID=1885344 RepID=UPI003B52BBC2
MIRPPQPPRPFPLLVRDAQRAGRLEVVFEHAFDPTPGGKYLPWDKLRHQTPPADLSPQEWWLGTKFARQPLLRDLPLVGTTGAALRYATPDPVTERLQRIDRDASGQILMAEQAVSPGHRDRYVVSSLIEESIMSSLLEGAATTRREAKEMLRAGRKPTTKGERMVLNNFRAMQRIKTLTDEDLSPDLIRHLHAILTERAADAGEPGQYRGPDDEDRFGVWSGDRRLYKPPSHDKVEVYVEQVCAFINGADGSYVHPVIKAIALHFWIGYVHPFEDGNGRTARALFYWFMLREGYWLFEFVSISSVLTDAYAKYARAYLYTETDENDLTYFLLFHLDVIDRALNSVQAYIRRKVQEIQETKAVLHPDAGLNARQIALLRHALHHPDAVYTFASHQTSHGVVYQTARTDLLALADRGLLTAGRTGRKYVFRVPPDLSERVRDAP